MSSTRRSLCGLVRPPRTSERGGNGYCGRGGWREGDLEKERTQGVRQRHTLHIRRYSGRSSMPPLWLPRVRLCSSVLDTSPRGENGTCPSCVAWHSNIVMCASVSRWACRKRRRRNSVQVRRAWTVMSVEVPTPDTRASLCFMHVVLD